jgi:hypothetical protein
MNFYPHTLCWRTSNCSPRSEPDTLPSLLTTHARAVLQLTPNFFGSHVVTKSSMEFEKPSQPRDQTKTARGQEVVCILYFAAESAGFSPLSVSAFKLLPSLQPIMHSLPQENPYFQWWTAFPNFLCHFPTHSSISQAFI